MHLGIGTTCSRSITALVRVLLNSSAIYKTNPIELLDNIKHHVLALLRIYTLSRHTFVLNFLQTTDLAQTTHAFGVRGKDRAKHCKKDFRVMDGVL